MSGPQSLICQPGANFATASLIPWGMLSNLICAISSGVKRLLAIGPGAQLSSSLLGSGSCTGMTKHSSPLPSRLDATALQNRGTGGSASRTRPAGAGSCRRCG